MSKIQNSQESTTDGLSNVESVYQLVGQVKCRDLVQENSKQLLKLAELINSISDGKDMRRVRNKLQRWFGYSYITVFGCLKKVVSDPLLFEMSMYRRPGVKQYGSFLKAMRSTISDKSISNEQKKSKLYRILSFEHDLFPDSSKRSGLLVPTDVHKWFWENLPREESFNHFYFLIKNDVLLSSCQYVWNFAQRLMQGSQLEVQLATFEIFLHDKTHQATFHSKFEKLYSFYAMNKLVNKVLSDRDFRYMKLYLSSLIHKMESLTSCEVNPHSRTKKKLFAQFNSTMLYYLCQTSNVEMFLETFKIGLQYMHKSGLMRDVKFTEEVLLRSLHFVLQLLRKKGLQEQVFQFIRVIQRVDRGKSPEFKRRVIGELISSLRTFNDPKLSCQYILSAFSTARSADLLNNLGLWAPIFHQDTVKLSQESLKAEAEAQEQVLPRSLKVHDTPSIPVLTELYRVLLSTCARTMSRDAYHDLILYLYSSYKEALHKSLFSSVKHDTGILSILLYHIRVELNDPKLAFETLKDFYSQKFVSKIRCTSKVCPFSWVVYKNPELSQSDISHLLHLMQLNRVPLQFRFCTAMVLRHLNLNNVEEAHSWYLKILHAGFEVKHTILIKAIVKNGWQYPKNFDLSLLDKMNDRSTYTNEDAMFFEENNELGDSEPSFENFKDNFAQVINLVEQLRPLKAQRHSD